LLLGDRLHVGVDRQHELAAMLGGAVVLVGGADRAAAVDEFGAKSAECVVMDPASGEIVALANFPTFSPQFLNESKPDMRVNRALVFPYEPGSTIKPFIVSRALDQKVSKLTDVYNLGGIRWKTPYGRTITDVHGYGDLTLWDVLVKSSNIGMSQLVERMGNPQLHAGLTSFGFGKQTDIDLPGEGRGILRPMRKWSRASPESLAQGYEMLVTPLQMARAMCAVANGGKLVTPRVVKGTLGEDGAEVAALNGGRPAMFASVVRDDTSAGIRRVLADIPIRGTATRGRSDVYNLFGKTGTAHRAVNGRYDTTHYTSSFVGGAPYESPRLVIAFVVHDPQKSKGHYGGIVAAPAASRILERSLRYLNVPPSPPLALPPAEIASLLHQFNPKAYDKKATGIANAAE
ncbi:penicillin-binding protein 2, partial [bacterium]